MLYNRGTRNEISLNQAVQKVVDFTQKYSFSSKYIQTKGSYWPNSYYFH